MSSDTAYDMAMVYAAELALAACERARQDRATFVYLSDRTSERLSDNWTFCHSFGRIASRPPLHRQNYYLLLLLLLLLLLQWRTRRKREQGSHPRNLWHNIFERFRNIWELIVTAVALV